MVQSQSVFVYFIFTFIFKQIIFKGYKKEAIFINAIYVPKTLLAHIYMNPFILSKIIITLPVPLMKKLRDSQVFAKGRKPISDRQAGI